MTTPNGTSGNTAAAGSSTLVRTLNFRDLLLLFIGAVIGSGIFLVPGGVLQQTGGSVGLALLVWVIGGVLSLLGALTYAELSAANPTAGGLYCYVRDAFGRFPAFLYGWCLFLVISSGSVAALARAFAIHLAEIVPLSRLEMTIAAVAVVAVVTAVNVWGTRKSSDLLNWMTLIKALVIVILSAVLLSLGRHASESFTANTPAVHGKDLFAGFGLAMIAVLWAYEGWQFATYNAGEALEPQRNFPRAFLAGSLILTGLYLLANLAYLAALGPVAAASSDAIAAASMKAVVGPWAGKLIALTILVSTFSAANSVVLSSPRVFYAMAQDKLFFQKLGEVHPRSGARARARLCRIASPVIPGRQSCSWWLPQPWSATRFIWRSAIPESLSTSQSRSSCLRSASRRTSCGAGQRAKRAFRLQPIERVATANSEGPHPQASRSRGFRASRTRQARRAAIYRAGSAWAT